MEDLAARISACTDDNLSWMRSNRLQLNAHQTDLVCHLEASIFTSGCSHKSVRDLRIYIDADLSMRIRVSKTTGGYFAALRQIKSVRRSLPTAAIQTLVVSLVAFQLIFFIVCSRFLMQQRGPSPVYLVQRITARRLLVSIGSDLLNTSNSKWQL